jgi:hypothetical protein
MGTRDSTNIVQDISGLRLRVYHFEIEEILLSK